MSNKILTISVAAYNVEKDFSTQDIFIGLKTAIEKKIWMIQAELGSAPEIDE